MGSGSTQTETVSGTSETETIISNLMPSTTYDVEVTAVNGAGTGVYSDPTSQLTQGLKCVCDLYSTSSSLFSPLQLRLQW